MNYKNFNLEDWVEHISGAIDDETTLDGNEMRDLVKFLSGLSRWIPASEDFINRQAMLDALDNIKYSKEFCEEHHIDWSVNLSMARMAVNEIESANFHSDTPLTSNDCISREALKQKLQDHHDFFLNAYGSFKDMTYKEKARVDEIDNCIAMVVNAPPVTPQQTATGSWVEKQVVDNEEVEIEQWQSARCSKCDKYHTTPYSYYFDEYSYCPNCGAKMEGEKDGSD